MRQWLACTLASAALALGCGGSGGNASDGGDPFGNLGEPGCVATPDCGGCDSCLAKCLCDVGAQAQQQCADACGVVLGGTGGTPGAGGTGAVAGMGAFPGTGGGTPPPPVERLPAGGVRVTHVSVMQGTEIGIMHEGQEIQPLSRNAAVVARRPALFRVYITPDQNFQQRELVVQLTTFTGGVPAPTQEISRFVAGPSFPDDFFSTFNFNVPPEQMQEDSSYQVKVLEAAPGFQGPGDPGGATWPPGGPAGIVPFAAGPVRVMIVPLWNNGILPDTSPGRIQQYIDVMFGMYPSEFVEINVRAPADPASVGIGAVQAFGGNWGATLNYVEGIRSAERADSRVYYYGVMAPTGSFGQFCGGGCTLGLGTVPPPQWEGGRVAIGIGFFPDGSGQSSVFTLAHELGHAHGLPHAPCQVPDAPPGFPHPGGGIGVWGYDIVTNLPYDPSHTDIMGYCNKQWISDFNYQRLFDRVSFVNQFGRVHAPNGPERYKVVIVNPDGTLEWGLNRVVDEPMWGEYKEVDTLDANGNVVGKIGGHFQPFDHLQGGFLYVREGSIARPLVDALRPRAVGTDTTLHLVD